MDDSMLQEPDEQLKVSAFASNSEKTEEQIVGDDDDDGDGDDDTEIKNVTFAPDIKTKSINNTASLGGSTTNLRNRFRSHQLTKQRSHIDIATGRETKREQSIHIVHEDDREAQSQGKRLYTFLFKKDDSKKVVKKSDDADEENDVATVEHGVDANAQYRIHSQSRSGRKIQQRKRRLWSLLAKITSQLVANYLTWTFRASFYSVALVSYMMFVLVILGFAICVWIVYHFQPQCLHQAGVEITGGQTPFIDAFALSWQTLSTVGYGVVYPEIAASGERCFAINMFMAFESFVGVLFGGVVGAIIFSKVARIQSIAQVRFSSPICVRYGTGVMRSLETGDDDAQHQDGTHEDALDLPCPIIEFRIVNLLSGEKKGEIMNASINCVASILENDEESESARSSLRLKISSNRNSIMEHTTKHTAKVAKKVGNAVHNTGSAILGVGKKATNATGSLIQQLNHHITKIPLSLHPDDSSSEAEPFNAKEAAANEKKLEKELEEIFAAKFVAKLERHGSLAGMMDSSRKVMAVDEGNAQLAPPRIHHKLEVETDNHPFFKRVWNIRHVLNEHSPLLTNIARSKIEQNNGYWPESMNNYESIRKNLRFNDIVVSFSGTAHASGASVFSQHVYDYVDANVGYTFANILIMEKGKLVVDLALLNDVTEQVGGGAEPFQSIRGTKGTIGATGNIGKRTTATAAQGVSSTTKAGPASALNDGATEAKATAIAALDQMALESELGGAHTKAETLV